MASEKFSTEEYRMMVGSEYGAPKCVFIAIAIPKTSSIGESHCHYQGITKTKTSIRGPRKYLLEGHAFVYKLPNCYDALHMPMDKQWIDILSSIRPQSNKHLNTKAQMYLTFAERHINHSRYGIDHSYMIAMTYSSRHMNDELEDNDSDPGKH